MDKKELISLEKIKQENFKYFRLVADYLNNFPELVSEEIMDEIGAEVSLKRETAFAIFLANALFEDENEIKLYEKEYLKKGIKCLDNMGYENDPYYKNIKIPNANIGEWTLGYQSYKAYEGFVCDDITVLDSYREIINLGFFTKQFDFPTVFENGVEWMAIKPNEIETMKPHIEKMQGDVAVFGLGIGYFAYMISEKTEVDQITIIEKDESVIKLFEKHILPQFPSKEKIRIIKCDAFDFAKNQMKNYSFDFAFVDLWHDVSDGVDMYLKMKKLEKHSPKTKFCYWIEKSILSNIRWQIFDGVYKKAIENKFDEKLDIKKYISDGYLRELIKLL
ncbi:MAG: hypothetical protein IJW54_04985 [Clostridia bacterium]|nr:hypothetical protein [Clostridia bacterium]